MNKKRLFVLAALVVLCVTIVLLSSNDRDPERSRRETTSKTPEPQLTQREVPAPPIAPPAEPTAFRQSFKFEEFDGRVVAGLAVRFNADDQTIDSETDESGLVEFTRKSPGKTRVEVLDSAWHLTKSEFVDATSPTTVVVYRELRLDGMVRVMDDEPVDLTSVKIGFSFGGARDGGEEGVSRLHRLIRTGISHSGNIANADAAGAFTGTLPRVEGFVVHATAPGWFAESVAVPMDHDADRVSVVLELRKGTRLHGRLLDDSGRPLPKGTSVQVFITVLGDPKTLTVEEAYRLRGSARCGMTCGISEVRGESVACFVYHAKTDEAGYYSAVVQQQGAVTVRAYVPGHVPATARGSWLQAQGQKLDLVAKRVVAPASVEIKLEGVLQKDTPVHVVDLVSRGPQMTVVTRTDGQGQLPDSWFEAGREYMVFVGCEPRERSDNRIYIRWSGQRSINVIPHGKDGHQGLPKDWW